MRGHWHRRGWLWAAALVPAAVIGLGALVHLPAARPFLARLGVPCPVGNVSAQHLDSIRRPALQSLQGRTIAPRRPALGFELHKTRERDALDWARERGVSCATHVRGLRYLRCRRVAAAALLLADGASFDDLTLAFDQRGVLVAVDALRSGLTAESAAAMGTRLTTRLRAELGAPAESAGEWTALHLGGGAMRTALVRHRFRDYLAFVTATQVPGSGVALHEQYLSAATGG